MTDEILTDAIISEEETVVSSLVRSIYSLADADAIFDRHCAALLSSSEDFFREAKKLLIKFQEKKKVDAIYQQEYGDCIKIAIREAIQFWLTGGNPNDFIESDYKAFIVK